MGRIEQLAHKYGTHIRAPWQRTVSGAQRVIIVVYDPELERTLRARKSLFENETEPLLRTWREVDVTDAFARWILSFAGEALPVLPQSLVDAYKDTVRTTLAVYGDPQ